ncbi:MAG TPA: pseudouridine synthase [Paenalcaligenes sp.]|nr:pseudouridine synthase [Paenalcaligenes sp.]
MIKSAYQSRAGLQSPLAGRDGVAPSRVWLPEGPWQYLGQFMEQRFESLGVALIRARLQRGDIVDGQGRAVHYYTPYRAQQWLWYYREVAHEIPVPFDLQIIHVDEHLIVIDKPHFLPSIPSGSYLVHTAVTRLRKHFDNYDISPLHRLDRETAGVMLFCRRPEYRGVYQTLFQSQEVFKEYEAIAPVPAGVRLPRQLQTRMVPVPGEFRMQCVSGAPNSDTYIELLKQNAGLGHYRLQPRTGRKHQLRVHMQALGAPIVNDRLYGDGVCLPTSPDFSQPLQLLARRIAFIDPLTHVYREFASQRNLEQALCQ